MKPKSNRLSENQTEAVDPDKVRKNRCTTEPGPAKRGSKPKLQQQLEELSRLPKPKQKFVMEMIDTVLQQEGQRG